MSSKSVIDDQRTIYSDQIKKYGDSPESTHNQLAEIQNLRFERLINQLFQSSDGKSIHDVGCGICDLYSYLKNNNYPIDYSGTDIVPAMKSLVKEKFPHLSYFIRDVIQESINDKYDFVVLSGTFNLPGNVEHNDWKEFTRSMIRAMYKMANKGIAFNFLTIKSDFYNPKMYYESIEEILDFCVNNLSRHVIIDHAYPLYEFTCTVLKPETVKKKYTEPVFEKYFKF
jgi:SAM-dependent methyltransferase